MPCPASSVAKERGDGPPVPPTVELSQEAPVDDSGEESPTSEIPAGGQLPSEAPLPTDTSQTTRKSTASDTGVKLPTSRHQGKAAYQETGKVFKAANPFNSELRSYEDGGRSRVGKQQDPEREASVGVQGTSTVAAFVRRGRLKR